MLPPSAPALLRPAAAALFLGSCVFLPLTCAAAELALLQVVLSLLSLCYQL